MSKVYSEANRCRQSMIVRSSNCPSADLATTRYKQFRQIELKILSRSSLEITGDRRNMEKRKPVGTLRISAYNVSIKARIFVTNAALVGMPLLLNEMDGESQ
jgi:hypothetical protein